MSGHSKWSKVKHQKAGTDAAKSAAFTKASRAITIAVHEGGGIADPDKNFRLRLAIELAKTVNMPKDTIRRAIDRAAGGAGGAIESVTYEGYGPFGVALMIEAATDNRQRTVSEVKNILERSGGTLASPGAVGYLFSRAGVVVVSKDTGLSYDTIFEAAADAGANDVRLTADDVYEIYTPYETLHAVGETLRSHPAVGTAVDQMYSILQPMSYVPLDPTKYQQVERLVELLNALDDVQQVYDNSEVAK